MPIDNGTVERLNNKAKLVIHKAYGFRTAKNYIRNLYHCLGNLSLPQTVHTFVCGTGKVNTKTPKKRGPESDVDSGPWSTPFQIVRS